MNVAVIGAGSWGTTLALVLHQNGHTVRCWAYESSIIADIAQTGSNTVFLPGISIPKEIVFTSDLNHCLENSSVLDQRRRFP